MPSTEIVVKTRRNRETGWDVQLIDGRATGRGWLVRCDFHGTEHAVETRRAGNAALATLTTWCSECAFDHFVDKFDREAKALDEPRIGSGYRAAYETRERVGRCVCCTALMHRDLTGYYDPQTCLACGIAQEVSEEDENGLTEYDRTARRRSAALRKLYGAKRHQQMTWDAAGIPPLPRATN